MVADPESLEVAREKAKFELEAANLETTVDTLIKVATRAVDALRNEMIGDSVTASKNRSISGDLLRKLEVASKSVAAAVKAQNDLFRTAKQRGQALTPEQRKQALVNAISKLPYDERRALVGEIIRAHNEKRTLALKNQIEKPREWLKEGLPKDTVLFSEVL